MKKRAIFITKPDYQRLSELILVESDETLRTRADLQGLDRELQGAKVVDSKKIPASVVTMNSKVRIRDLESGEDMVYQLVFPERANIDEGRLSVMSPIGTAIMGYSVGDTIEWEVPSGVRRIRIEEILFQPESAARANA